MDDNEDLRNRKVQKTEKVLGIATCISMFIPFLFLSNNGHKCEYDDCMMIFYDDKLGCCIEKALNDLCLFIATMWSFAVVGGALVLSKSKSAISPFLFIGVLLAISVFAALLDPSKWRFVFASSIPAVMFTSCAIYDSRIHPACKANGRGKFGN